MAKGGFRGMPMGGGMNMNMMKQAQKMQQELLKMQQEMETKEYSATWTQGMEPYYPVNNEKNGELYQQYASLAAKEEKVVFGGRLGEYKYYDMDKVLRSALDCAAAQMTK